MFDPGQADHGVHIAHDALGDHLSGLVDLSLVEILAGSYVVQSVLERIGGLVANLLGALDLFIVMTQTAFGRRFAAGVGERFDRLR